MAFEAELAAALEAADRAADLVRREYASFVAIPDPPVTISTHADKASQDLILRFLRDRFPGDALCAEESIPGFDTVPKAGPRAWVVDPIDGTRGFARKVGQFSVMVGFLAEGKPVVGVVAEPAPGRLTYATAGGGCWARDGGGEAVRCRVSARPPAEFVMARSWVKPGKEHKATAALKPARVVETYSGGVKLALVARGEADVYANVYDTFFDWDVCAGHVLVTEAGGTVTDLAGGPVTYQAADFGQRRGLLATNGVDHAEAVRRLASG
jgi:3'(2'), 5'-bisphosphate nucleotidase